MPCVCVNDVGQVGAPQHGRIGNHAAVDDPRAAPAAPVGLAVKVARSPPRRDRLAPAQRDPACTEGRPDRQAWKPAHQRRGIFDARVLMPRCPRPGAAQADPAAMVKGCVTPGRVVYPCQAVDRVRDPASGAVRRPAGRLGPRDPQRPVLCAGLPLAVAIQVGRSVHPGCQVTRSGRGFQLIGAGEVPPVPGIGRPRLKKIAAVNGKVKLLLAFYRKTTLA